MNFTSKRELEAFLDQNKVRFHKVAVTDIDGILRGKYLARDKFLSTLDKGFGFCDVVLGWDCQDQLLDRTQVSGWHTAYRDAPVELDLSTARLVPSEDDTVLVLGQFTGDYAAACPRQLLRRVIARAESMGLFARAAFEYEFFVFDETPESVREKGYRNLKPFTPGMFGYSMLRAGVHAELYQELLDDMRDLEVPIEGLHTETGPGVLEAAIEHAPALDAADRATLFKTYSKIFLQRRGLMGTFMAKWNDALPGQGGHIHVSLADRAGRSVFYDPNAPEGLSDTFRHFVAGQVTLLPHILPLVCATVNSYRRLVPGMWAPTHANWGIENRTTAVRAIPAGSSGTRSEYRIAPADANPYLALSAALVSGLYGIERRLELPPIVGNAYEQLTASVALPGTLGEATRAFAESPLVRELLGDGFVEHFTATREWEDRAARRHVSDFDLARYFEII